MSDQRYPYRFVCTHDPCVCDDALGGMYRIDAHAGKDWQDFRGVIQIMLRDGVLVPDTRLQAIADAWNYDDIGQGRYEFRQQWPELADLLDALTAEEGQ